MSKWDFRSVLSLDMILIFRFGSIRESIEMKLGMGGLTEWIDVTLYCTLLMPNPTFIKKKNQYRRSFLRRNCLWHIWIWWPWWGARTYNRECGISWHIEVMIIQNQRWNQLLIRHPRRSNIKNRLLRRRWLPKEAGGRRFRSWTSQGLRREDLLHLDRSLLAT